MTNYNYSDQVGQPLVRTYPQIANEEEIIKGKEDFYKDTMIKKIILLCWVFMVFVGFSQPLLAQEKDYSKFTQKHLIL